jgi:hypothetical protein
MGKRRGVVSCDNSETLFADLALFLVAGNRCAKNTNDTLSSSRKCARLAPTDFGMCEISKIALAADLMHIRSLNWTIHSIGEASRLTNLSPLFRHVILISLMDASVSARAPKVLIHVGNVLSSRSLHE